MVDGVFFVSSALNVKQLSVFNNHERFFQTEETIKSIQKYCSNNKIILFDASYEMPKKEYIDAISKMGVDFLFTGNNVQVKHFSEVGLRSLAETISFIIALDYFSKNKVPCERIYKMSGRYKLNDNFILNRDEFKDSFVFLPTVNSWMSKEKQEEAGVDRIFELRLWHMDSSLFDTFQLKLPIIFNDCVRYGIDVEHSYYKNLHMHKWVETKPIGLEGVIAPTGAIINE